MESVWDYVMRRKPIFLGYFLLFIVSSFASFEFLNYLVPGAENPAPSIAQESSADAPHSDDHILSPEAVAALSVDSAPAAIATANLAPEFIHVDIIDDQTIAAAESAAANPVEHHPTASDNTADQPAEVAEQPVADVPLTGSLRPVSVFRTILAVLLAVTSLTLAGLGLYQTYEYFSNL